MDENANQMIIYKKTTAISLTWPNIWTSMKKKLQSIFFSLSPGATMARYSTGSNSRKTFVTVTAAVGPTWGCNQCRLGYIFLGAAPAALGHRDIDVAFILASRTHAHARTHAHTHNSQAQILQHSDTVMLAFMHEHTRLRSGCRACTPASSG